MNIKDTLRNPKIINYVIIPLVVIISLFVLYIYLFEPFSGSDRAASSKRTNEDVINTSTPVLSAKREPGRILDIYEQSKEDSINRERLNSDIDLNDGGTRKKGSTYVADDFYAVDEETKQIIRELEMQEKQLGQSKSARSGASPPSYTGGGPSVQSQPKAKTAAEEEEAYRQSLLQGREEMLRQHQQSTQRYQTQSELAGTGNNTTKELVEFRASIYEDQRILPGDRVKLVLQKDLVYNQKLFPKGTFIYAFADVNQSRVLLDIDNIAHIPLKLVAKDITDGRVGIYSTDAGKLWLKYKDQAQANANDQLASDIARGSSSTLLGTAIRGLASFFKSSQIRERDRILLVNNHEVILTNKTLKNNAD